MHQLKTITLKKKQMVYLELLSHINLQWGEPINFLLTMYIVHTTTENSHKKYEKISVVILS